jgi:hypothetical protein
MKYDKLMVKDFLMHLAGELKVQQLGFQGKPAGAKLLQGVQSLRAKYGTHLLPDVDRIGILTSTPDGDGDEEREATRQAIAKLRGDQLKHAVALYELMGELEFYEMTQQERD